MQQRLLYGISDQKLVIVSVELRKIVLKEGTLS